MNEMRNKTQATVRAQTSCPDARAAEIKRLEREILKSVPYDNWSAGTGARSSLPKVKASEN